MKETELKPCCDIEEVKKQANHYINCILVGTRNFLQHGQIITPTVFMSRDVFDILAAETERALYINYKFCRICGCEVEIINGNKKLYIGYDLLQ